MRTTIVTFGRKKDSLIARKFHLLLTEFYEKRMILEVSDENKIPIHLNRKLKKYVVKLVLSNEIRKNNSELHIEEDSDFDIIRAVIFIGKLYTTSKNDLYEIEHKRMLEIIDILIKDKKKRNNIIDILFGLEYKKEQYDTFVLNLKKVRKLLGKLRNSEKIKFKLITGKGPRD